MSFEKWTEFPLEDLAEMKYGKMPKKDKIKTNGFPIFSGYRVVGFYDEFMFEKPELIVVARGVGGTGDVKISPPKSWVTNLSIVLSLNEEKVDKKFLYYKLGNENLRLLDSGSAQSQITISDLKRYKINIPPINEQKSIENILSSLDEKIETNNQINKKLQEMTQTIYEHWFEEFQFPNEDGDPYKASGGELLESELGMIPKCWKVIETSEFVTVADGTHASPKKQNTGFPLLTSKHIKGNKLLINEANLISEEDYIEVNKRSKVDTNDILITMIGTVGVFYYVREENIKFAIKNLGLFKTSQKEVYANYIYLYLTSKQITDYILTRHAGSTQQYISLTELRKIPLLLPSEAVIKKFNHIIEPIFKMIHEIKIQNQSLINTRDALLPKLMSGKIRVPIES
jgi:type I restriction enzyme, S subunit